MTEKNTETLRSLADACRKQLEADFCELVEEMGQGLVAEARTLAGSSRDDTRRRACLNLQLALRDHWVKVLPALRDELDRRRQQAAKPGQAYQEAENLQILSDSEIAIQLAVQEVVGRITTECRDETKALERRISYLVLRNAILPGDTTFRVASLCNCLETACKAVTTDTSQQIVLMQMVGGHLSSELPPLFRAINELLVEADILPRLKQSYQIAASSDSETAEADSSKMTSALEKLVKAKTETRGIAAPTDTGAGNKAFFHSLKTLHTVAPATAPSVSGHVNLVRLARDSDAARNVGAQESVTLDIAAELFDLIFGDKSVADGIKALVARLQTPVLKVAMLNQRFFADRSHPARRFIDSISAVAIRWGKSVDANDPFYCKLTELVDRIQHTYDGDIAVFEEANAELAEFITEREAIEAEENNALAEAVRAREEELHAQREGQLRAQKAADQRLVPLVTSDVPTSISQFLLSYWRDVVQARVFASGEDSAAVNDALQVAAELLWTVVPKHKPEDRKRQAATLPPLLKRLIAGLDEIGTSAAERKSFMDTLVDLQLSALRADSKATAQPESREPKKAPVLGSGPTLQISHATDSGVRVQDISLPGNTDLGEENSPDRAHLRRVRQLVRGDWVDFTTAGQTRRERLTWINPSRTLLLFTNSASACAISITPEALAVRMKNQTANIVKPDTPIFERALQGAVQTLEQRR